MSTRERRTLIRAGWVIAFDGRGHRLLRDGVVVVEGGRIVQVGPRFEGSVDETVDARDRVLTPGLISTHAHIGGSPLDRSFIEDRGSPQFWYSGSSSTCRCAGGPRTPRPPAPASTSRWPSCPRRRDDRDGDRRRGRPRRGAGRPLRPARLHGLSFRSGAWHTRDGRRVVWEWNEEEGKRGLARAVAALEKHDGAQGTWCAATSPPAQVDTCAPELLREAKRRADEARPALHGAHRAVGRRVQRDAVASRQDPIAWLSELGVLGSNTVLGHAIIVGGSSRTNYPAGDVQLMADAGCSVAHAVWVFARRGILMESFARYKAAGVNMSLGTDTNPQSVIEAMRWAAVCSKIVERSTQATTAADAFDAATLGGARALGRDDLGRIAPGARADLVLWKAASWAMTPLRDPVKNIVFNATAEDVDRVYVDGRLVVDGGRVLAADERAILAALQAAGDGCGPACSNTTGRSGTPTSSRPRPTPSGPDARW